MTNRDALRRFRVSELPQKAPAEILLALKIGVGSTQYGEKQSYNLSTFSGSSCLMFGWQVRSSQPWSQAYYNGSSP